MRASEPARSLGDLTGPRLLLVDEVCDRFEAAWIRDERPRPEDYARQIPEPDRLVGIRELIRVDVEYRVRGGDTPSPRDYAFDPAPEPAWIEQVIAAEGRAARPDPSSTTDRIGATDPAPGEPGTLGRYRLLETLGSGANGTVWKAVDRDLDRLVALKIPHAHRSSADSLARFSREARVVARLRHPGIVTLHEVLHWEGRPVLVSDYVEGSSLADLLASRRPSPARAARLAARLADTLAYVHQMGAVHRDIKPANVMIPRGADGTRADDDLEDPRLLDFGLAILAGSEAMLTRDVDLLG